jgi:Glyoxalase-like domain
MSLATYKDFCIDAVDAHRLGEFWGAVLGLSVEHLDDGDAKLTGPTPQHTVWINTVPEPKTVKQRVHVDVWLDAVSDAEALGATVVYELPGWTTLQDPEGGELCVFTSDASTTTPRHIELNVDTGPDPVPIAQWWATAFGGELHHADDYSYVDAIHGCPFRSIAFGPVPEPKTVKNRIHMDVYGEVPALVAAGATVVAELPNWTVMADPEGNEFCAFAAPS